MGICSFARFLGELLQLEPSAPDPDPVDVAADGPEAPLQDRGRTMCFSALGMVQCCKVGVAEQMGERTRTGGWGFWQALGRCWNVESDRRT